MNSRISIVSPRLECKPWGGQKLTRFGFPLQAGESIGEALVTAGEALVSHGFGAGESLGEIVASDPEALLGASPSAAVSGRALFPLLVKLIDARENLSIQVHPNNDDASGPDRLGKTEAWHVLAAEAGAVLYLGVQPGVDFDDFKTAAARLDGSAAPLMRTIPAQPGITVLIPAGTIHALGAGAMVYEVQQPSDVTYRLDDWGRVDARGQPREMHLEAGFAVSDPASTPEPIEPVSLRPAVGEHHLLAACRFFSLERVSLHVGGSLDVGSGDSPTVVTVIEGAASIQDLSLATGMSAVVWPTAGLATLIATKPMIALVAMIPDLNRDVVRRVCRANTDPRTIAVLGGSTGDVLAAMKP
ncbi:class I mannose-6-phosphate isomerase [soil metagenome]